MKGRIAIAEKIVRSFVPGKPLAESLRRPHWRRPVGNGGVYDAPTFMGEDYQHEQEPTRRCRHDEEIRRCDLVDVIR
jgi:hypothetical protein